MTAKKQDAASPAPSMKVPEKPADQPVSKRGTRKKVSKPAKKRLLKPKPLPRHEDHDPKALADLAVRIIQLGGGTEAAPLTKPLRLTTPVMHDALDDAKRLLLAAAGEIDEDVDAYRIFSLDDDLMSYDEIAVRFKTYGWRGMTARNTVEKIILKLVESAQKEVLNEMDKFDELCSARRYYLGGVYGLADHIRKRIRAVIDEVELGVLLSNPDRVAEAMGQVFLCFMKKDIIDDWERSLDEEGLYPIMVTTFIKYVCGGMSYEQFMSEGKCVRMDYNRLAYLGHFLEDVDNWVPWEYKAMAKKLKILMRIFPGPGGKSALLFNSLKACLEELRKTPAQVETVKRMIKAANAELWKFCDRMHLSFMVAMSRLRLVAVQIQTYLASPVVPEQPSAKDLKLVLDLIQQSEESVRDPNFEPAEVREALNKLHEKLCQLSSPEGTHAQQSAFVDTEKAVEILGRRLRAEKVKPTALEMSIEDLISDLEPSKKARRCRPYELFLFAAQNRLCREELVRRRSDLASGVVTGPAHRSSLSILGSHRGGEIPIEDEFPV